MKQVQGVPWQTLALAPPKSAGNFMWVSLRRQSFLLLFAKRLTASASRICVRARRRPDLTAPAVISKIQAVSVALRFFTCSTASAIKLGHG